MLTILELKIFFKKRERISTAFPGVQKGAPRGRSTEPGGVQKRLSKRSLSQVTCRGKNLPGRDDTENDVCRETTSSSFSVEGIENARQGVAGAGAGEGGGKDTP